MPIRPENKHRYPADWKEIRKRILTRAGHKCEQCGVPNHAVGYRDRSGKFIPNAGNRDCDASGEGRYWDGRPLEYDEAQAFANQYNDSGRGKRKTDEDGNHWIVIVLTIAHYPDPAPENCSDDNLQALCQRCHFLLDRTHHLKARTETLRRRKAERMKHQQRLPL